MNEITFKVKSCTVLLTTGQDIIDMKLDAPTPYPNMGYDAHLEIKTQYDYGEIYCRNVLKIEPRIINVRH